MATRQYGQYCAIAKALDVLGDRWALLVVRELLFGPLRYIELQAALPGIATDMLAARLRDLEKAGVISRASGDRKPYELTTRGYALRSVLEDLAVWGLGELGTRTPDEAFDAKWMALPFSGLVRPERAAEVALSVRLVTDGDEITMRFEGGQLRFTAVDGPPDVTIEGPLDALAAAATAPNSPAARRLQVRGESRHVEQLLYILGFADTPPRLQPVTR